LIGPLRRHVTYANAAATLARARHDLRRADQRIDARHGPRRLDRGYAANAGAFGGYSAGAYQKDVYGTCGAGGAIGIIAYDGNVTCNHDSVRPGTASLHRRRLVAGRPDLPDASPRHREQDRDRRVQPGQLAGVELAGPAVDLGRQVTP
jgi:hypothetical protein